MMVYALENLWTSYNVNIAHPHPSELQRMEQMCKCMEHKERLHSPILPQQGALCSIEHVCNCN